MLIFFRENRVWSRCVCGVFLLLAFLFGQVMCRCLDGGEEVWVYAVFEENGIGEEYGYIGISQNLYDLTEGNALAVRLSITVSEGWRIDGVKGTASTAGMQVTVGFSADNRRAQVLLDGYPSEEKEGEVCLLLGVKLARTGEENLPCALTVGAGKSGEGVLYYLDSSGEMSTVPLYFATPAAGTESAETRAQEEISEEDTRMTGGDASDETAALPSIPHGGADSTETEPTESQAEPPPKPTEGRATYFVGCQETPAREGVYAVRFLFYGREAYTPVLCLRGGGQLTLTVTASDSVRAEVGSGTLRYDAPVRAAFDGETDTAGLCWYVCTFSGLAETGEYVFSVGTDEGEIRAVYRDGAFVGYGYPNGFP